MRFDHDDPAVDVERHALGPTQIGLGHLPEQQKVAVAIELLDATGHVHDEQVVALVHGQRTRLVELAGAAPARAENLSPFEEPALRQTAVVRVPGTARERQHRRHARADSCPQPEAAAAHHRAARRATTQTTSGSSASPSKARQSAFTCGL